VAKHATATRCEIRVRLVDGRLVVEVEDDGVGGAMVVPGGGLAGLAGRVEALDGSLTVISPSAGPTLVRAEIALPGPAAGSPAAPASTAVSSVPPVPPATASPTSGWVAPGQEPR
jgi:signal transduction histidine kinase